MNVEPLMKCIVSLLEIEVEQLVPEAVLETFDNWDSLTKVSLIVGLRDLYNIKANAEELDNLTTFGDLVKLVRNKQSLGVSTA